MYSMVTYCWTQGDSHDFTVQKLPWQSTPADVAAEMRFVIVVWLGMGHFRRFRWKDVVIISYPNWILIGTLDHPKRTFLKQEPTWPSDETVGFVCFPLTFWEIRVPFQWLTSWGCHPSHPTKKGALYWQGRAPQAEDGTVAI